jgi:hypothetical protein
MHGQRSAPAAGNTFSVQVLAYLLVGLEHVALEHVTGAISRDVAEDLEVL